MRLIDTHAHVNFSAYKDDSEAVIKRALKNEVWLVNVGSEYRTSVRAVEMARKYPEGVFAAVGLHPVHLSSETFHDKVDDQEEVEFAPAVEEYSREKYRNLAKDPKVVAIGEIGLDYFHVNNSKIKNQKAKLQFKNQNLEVQNQVEKQKEVFINQIDLAIELNLPIMVHCREAHDDIIEILREKQKKYGRKLRGVIHCFTGNLKQAEIYTGELGFYLGWNGLITFTDSYDKVLRSIDLDYFLTETDCPYLTPVPFRGQRNEPLYTEKVAEKIAGLRGKTVSEIAEITVKNAKKLFDLK